MGKGWPKSMRRLSAELTIAKDNRDWEKAEALSSAQFTEEKTKPIISPAPVTEQVVQIDLSKFPKGK